MPNRTIMEQLVEAHTKLDDPISAAIWIRGSDAAAWLVEVLPEMPDDTRVLEPVVFSPTADFRYSLHLIAGNLRSLKRALRTAPELARDIVNGDVLLPSNDSEDLLQTARSVANP